MTAGRTLLRHLNVLWAAVLVVMLFLIVADWLSSDLAPHNADLEYYIDHGVPVLDGRLPYVDFSFEYPVGAAAIMAALSVPVRHEPDIDTAIGGILPGLFIANAVLAGVILVCLAGTRTGSGALRGRCVSQAAVLLVALAPIAAFRFDLFPVATMVIALLAVSKEKFVLTGVAIAVGTLLKFFPVLLLVPLTALLVARGQRSSLMRCGTAFISVMVLSMLVYAGHGCFSSFGFLRFQVERGFQIESTGSVIALIARSIFGVHTVIVGRFGAQEIDGPLVPSLLRVQQVTMPATFMVVVLYLLWTAKRAKATQEDATEILSRMCGLLFTTLLLCSKVFSTQYILWLVPFYVGGSRKRFAAFLLAVALTLFVFPFRYAEYMHMPLVNVGALAVRVVVLIGLAVADARWLWSAGTAADQFIELRRSAIAADSASAAAS